MSWKAFAEGKRQYYYYGEPRMSCPKLSQQWFA